MEMVALLWIICWIATIVVSSKKGEGGTAVITGFLFGPLALIVALAGKGNRMECPKCKELVNKKANVCPHCRSNIFDNEMPTYEQLKEKNKMKKLMGE